jgi:serine/tyrosine/threonine adenylyltransferase
MARLIPFNNSYIGLGEPFFSRQKPTPVRSPQLLHWNMELAMELGIDIPEAELAEIFSGNRLPEDAEPVAMAYAGHQFGHFVPQLGDGRALLLGEVVDRKNQRRDLHFKGSGSTPYSRRGDGRAALGPVIRELVISEAMHALGIPTSRTLAAVRTGETVWRETAQPGGVLTRVAASHIRIGTFEFFAARGMKAEVEKLLHYSIDRHYPQIKKETQSPAEQAVLFLTAVCQAQARLIAEWMRVGFIHGVMNTDNMTISGETIDYGPCAFLDHYDPGKVFSSIDQHGRYAFSQQPGIAQWNLSRLAECLLPLFDHDETAAIAKAESVLNQFPREFEGEWLMIMRRKLGLADSPGADAENKADIDLIVEFLSVLHATASDFTNSFLALGSLALGGESRDIRGCFFEKDARFPSWLKKWQERRAKAQAPEAMQAMNLANPVCIPRNHLVEQAIEAAVNNQDDSKVKKLLDALLQPYSKEKLGSEFTQVPRPEEMVTKTFCGT